MTFSNHRVRSLLDAFFTCRWINLEGDRAAGGSPRVPRDGGGSASGRGTGYSNVQLCVYTPEGRLLHVLTGYISATELVWELCHALITHDAVVHRPAARSERGVVMRRADRIQRALETKTPDVPQPDRRVLRHAKRDRKTLKQHAYARIEDVKTRWLTRGNRAGGFGGDGDLWEDSKLGLKGTSHEPHRPPPWAAMPPALREAVRAAFDKRPPAAERAPRPRHVIVDVGPIEFPRPSADTPRTSPASAPPRSRR